MISLNDYEADFCRSKNLKIGNCFNLFGNSHEMISKLGTNWCKSASLLGALKCMASKCFCL